MKIKKKAIDVFVSQLAVLAIPLSLVKSWALLPLLLSKFGSQRAEPVRWPEVIYVSLVCICFIGNLIFGRQNNFNADVPMSAQFITCALMFFWLLVVHSLNTKNLAAVILFYLIAVNISTLFLIGYTFATDPIVLFSRRFLSPLSGAEEELIATPSFGNSSGIMLVASIGFLRKRYQCFGLFAAVFVSLMLQNRTLMVISVCAAAFILTSSRERIGAVVVVIVSATLALIMLPDALLLGTLEVLQARLSEEGVSSDRWVLVPVVVHDILSAGNHFGGLDPNEFAYYTYYFHNGVLDSYKTFGLVGLVCASGIIVYVTYALIRSFSAYKFLVWFVGVGVFLTAVVFEGTKFEAYTLFLLLSLLFRRRVSGLNNTKRQQVLSN